MTAAGYALGRLRPGASRGGDCHVNDLHTGQRWDGPHGFAAPEHCQLDNGLLRLTVPAAGTAPALSIEARRGRVVVGDTLSNTLSNTLPGSRAVPAWIAMGVLTVDSPDVTALLTGVRLVRINPEVVIVRLVAPLMADAFITLRRGWRSVGIHHGSTRPPFADIGRRISLSDSPAPVGTAFPGRVEEMDPATASFPRFVASIDPVTVDAGAFSVTAGSVTTARFTAGVGTYALRDRPGHLHKQYGDASRADIFTHVDTDAA